MTAPSEKKPRSLKPATQLVHGGALRSPFGELSEALFLTSELRLSDHAGRRGSLQGRRSRLHILAISNPTVAMFEQRMCLLEGAEASRATASGMAAVTASLLSQVKAGDHVVAARALFGSCLYVVEELLPRFGVASTLVDGADLEQWKQAVRKETKLFFLENSDQSGTGSL